MKNKIAFMKKLTELKKWQDLANHQSQLKDQHMRNWFREDLQRFSRFILVSDEILLDFSRNRMTKKTIDLLCRI